MKEKANIKTKIAIVGIIVLTLLIIGIISVPNVIEKVGTQVAEKEEQDAVSAQVLSGKTFTSSAAGVGAVGSLADFTNNLQTATVASNATGISTINVPAGYYEQIQVDASAVYNAGLANGKTTHTGTYTYPVNSTGGTYDMGTDHTYRYVNASNVYNKGKSDGAGTLTASYVQYMFNGTVNGYKEGDLILVLTKATTSQISVSGATRIISNSNDMIPDWSMHIYRVTTSNGVYWNSDPIKAYLFKITR